MLPPDSAIPLAGGFMERGRERDFAPSILQPILTELF